MRVLGIETSCDETGVAIYDSDSGIIAQALYSQIAMHAEYGGVVPELASRDHVRKLIPLVKKVLKDAQQTPQDLDAVAYTAGPGLAGALLVGASTAEALAMGWNLPAIPVHHMEGHLLAPLLEDNGAAFPFLALLVSGGHSLLLEARALGDYRLLGESVDDAVGEAFDKAAKMMGLPYPGGPAISQLAKQGQPRFTFPRPMTNKPGLNMSFSGLKTHTLNTVNQLGGLGTMSEQDKADVALAFEQAAVDTLVIKCRRAFKQTGLDQLVVAGGVSANRYLRQRLNELADKSHKAVFFPAPAYCTDNGAMIAFAAALHLHDYQATGRVIQIRPRWPMDELLAS